MNTLLATLQLVNRICDLAVLLTDPEMKELTWLTFLSGCTQPELIQYLKERRLYINDSIHTEEEV